MKYIKVFIIIFLLISIILPIAYAQKTNKVEQKDVFKFETPETRTTAPGYFSLVLRTLFVLAVLVIGLYYLFKLIAKKQGLPAPTTDIIKIISSVPVGTNRFVQLIELNNNYFLIGVTETNITLLKEITDKETITFIQIQKNKQIPRTEKITFFSFIKELFGASVEKSKKFYKKDFLKNETKRLKKLEILNK